MLRGLRFFSHMSSRKTSLVLICAERSIKVVVWGSASGPRLSSVSGGVSVGGAVAVGDRGGAGGSRR